MTEEDSILNFIECLAIKIERLYKNRCADIDDYIQAGHMKLLEINHKRGRVTNFKAYAIVAIARAMRDTAVSGMCAVSAPYRIKRRVHKIESLLNKEYTEREICDLLQISMKQLVYLRSLIQVSSLHMMSSEPSDSCEPFCVLTDILSSDKLEQDDKDFICLLLSDAKIESGLSRKQTYTKTIKLRPKLEESGYGK